MSRISMKLTGIATLAASLLATSALAADVKDATVAFLMPDQGSTRYEEHDYPGFKAEMAKLCPTGKVIYQNAGADNYKKGKWRACREFSGFKNLIAPPFYAPF